MIMCLHVSGQKTRVLKKRNKETMEPPARATANFEGKAPPRPWRPSYQPPFGQPKVREVIDKDKEKDKDKDTNTQQEEHSAKQKQKPKRQGTSKWIMCGLVVAIVFLGWMYWKKSKRPQSPPPSLPSGTSLPPLPPAAFRRRLNSEEMIDELADADYRGATSASARNRMRVDKDSSVRETREGRESREPREGRDARENRDIRENRDNRENREVRALAQPIHSLSLEQQEMKDRLMMMQHQHEQTVKEMQRMHQWQQSMQTAMLQKMHNFQSAVVQKVQEINASKSLPLSSSTPTPSSTPSTAPSASTASVPSSGASTLTVAAQNKSEEDASTHKGSVSNVSNLAVPPKQNDSDTARPPKRPFLPPPPES